MKIRIQHQTTYRYAEKVAFGLHRMMLRPREGHDIHIESSVLDISPAHYIRWIRDVYGNSIALVEFSEASSELVVYSEVILNHFEANPFDFHIEPEAIRYPFSYPPSHRSNFPLFSRPLIPVTSRRSGNGSISFGDRAKPQIRWPCFSR